MTTSSGVIIVTGANGGLGSAISKTIATSPDSLAFHGIYTVRNVETAIALAAALTHAKPDHQHDVVALDLSKLANVRAVAASINTRVANNSLPPIRALILNAAFQEHTTQTFTDDGYDMSFQSNYLSHWMLTLLLLQSMDKEHGRIVVVSSCGHDPNDPSHAPLGMFKEERWKTMFNGTESLAKGTWSSPKEDPAGEAGMRRYCASKLCQVMMIYELQRRLDADPELSKICVLGVDPGSMPTELLRRGSFLLSKVATKIFLPLLAAVSSRMPSKGLYRTTKESAKDVLRAALDVATLGRHPKAVYVNGTEPSETSPESRDETKQAMLWRDSVKYTGLTADETVLSVLD